MAEGAKSYQYSLDPTFSGGDKEFIALHQGSHYSHFYFPWTNQHPSVPLSGKTTSSPSLCFLKHDYRVGISSVVGSSSGVWLPVWVLEASFLTPCFSCSFHLNLSSSCKSFPGSEELSKLIWWPSPWLLLVAFLSITAVSLLSHCSPETKLFGACIKSGFPQSRNVSEMVSEILSQFCIRTQNNFVLISPWKLMPFRSSVVVSLLMSSKFPAFFLLRGAPQGPSQHVFVRTYLSLSLVIKELDEIIVPVVEEPKV